jgi:aminoglycoside 6'-N-acetyltransferase I
MRDEIIPFTEWTVEHRRQAASVLNLAFSHQPTEWRDIGECEKTTNEYTDDPARRAFGYILKGELVGWIGSIQGYPSAWELHPLAVKPAYQHRGIGSALVHHLEGQAARQRICAIWLGTDDDFGGTNLYGKNLFPDVLGAIAKIAPTAVHPFTFYLKHGYVVTGVIPDANGIGKPDILMAKQISGGV